MGHRGAVQEVADEFGLPEDGAGVGDGNRIPAAGGELAPGHFQKPGHIFQVAAGAGGALIVGEKIKDPALFNIQGLGVLAADFQKDEMLQPSLEAGPQKMSPDLGDGGKHIFKQVLAVAGDHQPGRRPQTQPMPVKCHLFRSLVEIIPVEDEGVQLFVSEMLKIRRIGQFDETAAEVQPHNEGRGIKINAGGHRQRPPDAGGCGDPGEWAGRLRW